MRNNMQKSSIQNMMNIEILMKKKTDYFNKKHNIMSIHKELSKLDSNKTQINYDATSLYPFALWDEYLFILK